VIPTEQRVMAIFDESGDNVQRGDCLTACVASIFELPIDQVPFFVESESWWDDYQAFFCERGFQVGEVRISVDDDDPTKLTGHPTDGIYWIATVKSPRGKARCSVCEGTKSTTDQWDSEREEYAHFDEPQACSYCGASGLVPSLHCVVMCGGELVWDPHPRRDMGHLGWVSGEWLIARDPAVFELRAETRLAA
jgi:hypothetical protein